jgi:RNA polymerase sigma factor (sigma-70 family)
VAAGAARPTEDGPDDLAVRIAAGDARAFERLYRLHRAEISRYCATMVRNPHDAEEAFQLTMLAAYRALSAGRGPRGALRPWLFRIAHNECVDILRGRPPVEELTDRHPVAGLLHERVEAREALRQLNDDIAALPLRQRAAFVLHEIDGLPHAAVGEALGTTDLGARQLLHEARTTLEEFHAGRDLACDDVRVRIGRGDRRILRGRGISAHLRGCASCREARAALQGARGGRRRRLLVAAATAAIVAGMVALGVRSLAAAPSAGGPAPVPVAATPAPLTAPSLGTAPAPAAPMPAAPAPAPAPAAAPAGGAAPAAEPLPAPPLAPDPEIVTVQPAPAPEAAPAQGPVPVAPPAASDPVVTVDPATGEPSALAVAPPEEAPPPPNHKPDHPSPAPPTGPAAPAPAPEPPGEVTPPEETPAPEPVAPELAPQPPATDAPAEAPAP